MTNAELLAKIKAEIDRLYGEYKDKFHQCGDQYHLGLIDGLDMAERVLDSIESEKPSEGLEEEIGSYMSNKWKFGCITPITPVVLPNFTTEDLKECARHFAQWGAEHLKK